MKRNFIEKKYIQIQPSKDIVNYCTAITIVITSNCLIAMVPQNTHGPGIRIKYAYQCKV